MTERLTDTIHVPLPRSVREQIDQLAEIEDRKPATVARRLIMAALAAQQQQPNGAHHA